VGRTRRRVNEAIFLIDGGGRRRVSNAPPRRALLRCTLPRVCALASLHEHYTLDRFQADCLPPPYRSENNEYGLEEEELDNAAKRSSRPHEHLPTDRCLDAYFFHVNAIQI